MTRPKYWAGWNLIRETKLSTLQKGLLFLIHGYANNESEWAFSQVETFAKDMSLSDRHVKTLFDEVRKLGVVESRRCESRPNLSRRRKEHRIVWETLLKFHEPRLRKAQQQGNPGSPIEDHQGNPNSPTQGNSDSFVTAQKGNPGSRTTPKGFNNQENPPPSTTRIHHERPPPNDEWRAVGAEIRKLGVNVAPSKVLTKARDQGNAIDDVRSAIGHYLAHPGAWEPGALYEAITLYGPDTPIDERFPDPKPGYQARQQAAKEQERQAVNDELQRLRREAEKVSVDELESAFGELLDALAPADTEALILRFLGDGAHLKCFKENGRGVSHTLRPVLLRLLYIQSHITTHSKETMR